MQTRPADARTCSVVSGPAVALESDPAKRRSLKLSPFYCTLSWEYRLLYFVSLKNVSG